MYSWNHFRVVLVNFGTTKGKKRKQEAYQFRVLTFSEAVYLVNSGGGFSINDKIDLQNVFVNLNYNKIRKVAAEKSRRYILENEGVSVGVVDYLEVRGQESGTR